MSEQQAETNTFEWTPPAAGGAPIVEEIPLGERVSGLVEDRGSSAADLTMRTAKELHAWLCAPSTPDAGVGALLDEGLAELDAAHRWRGTYAGLRAVLDQLSARGAGDETPALREALQEECALWLETGEGGSGAGWDGTPLAAGIRIPDRSRCAAPLLEGPRGLEEGEVILVHGWSETVARGVELAHARGLAPRVLVSEGGPDLGGRRLARRLVAGGSSVRFVYDAALVEAVRRADRVWLGTDAIGARAFVGRVGTRALLERARDMDVPTAVLATRDKLMPGGGLDLPGWPADEPWHLWEGAPRDVVVESQSFEAVPLDLPDAFATDLGLLSAVDFSVQALRI